MTSKFSTLSKRLLNLAGANELSRDFLYLTLVHVLYMLGLGLSSVFVSVFLFKMNGNDYVLTARYSAYLYLFEAITFTVCIIAYKFTSVINCMKLGLVLYAAGYIMLLVFADNVRDYYILIAFILSSGAAFYWSGHYILLRQHTTITNRQLGFGFLGIWVYVVSVIVSPISGFITGTFSDMTGYIIIFAITIGSFIISMLYLKEVNCERIVGYKINLSKAYKLAFKSKGALCVFISEFLRGTFDGTTAYYTPILLYSITSNEIVLGISLMLKHIFSIGSCVMMKKIKNTKQRFMSAMIPLCIELILLVVLIVTLESSLGKTLVFIFSAGYVLISLLLNNLSQIPLFDVMTIMKKQLNSEYEFLPIRQMFFSVGRLVGIVILLVDPSNSLYCLCALIGFGILSFFGAILCNHGAKLLSNEDIH